MGHGPDEPHVLPELTEEAVDQVLALLGYPVADIHQCENCAPTDAAERIAAKLGGVQAVTQVHIAHRAEHMEAVTGSYHLVREHLGHGECSCKPGQGAILAAGASE